MTDYQNEYTMHNNTSADKAHLNKMLSYMENTHPFSNSNFISSNNLVFLWLIGEDSDELKNFIHDEIEKIVKDKRTIRVITSGIDIDLDTIYNEFTRNLDIAAYNYLEADLFSIKVCPVFTEKSFHKAEEEQFFRTCIELQKKMSHMERFLEWHPFALLESQNIRQININVSAVRKFMDEVIAEGERQHTRCCFPCCVITDINENGLRISKEQMAKIIVMTIVFTNTHCRDEITMREVISAIMPEDKKYFFTSRAISVCEPVQSLTINRLLAVQKKFYIGMVPGNKAIDNIPYSFYESNEWKDRVKQVPHGQRHEILTAPVYSVIPDPADEKNYENSLLKFGERYYLGPFRKDTDRSDEAWYRMFLSDYLMRVRGSGKDLENLEKNKDTIFQRIPRIQVSVDQKNHMPIDLRKKYENYLVGQLQQVTAVPAANVLNTEGIYMKRFRKKVREINEAFNSISEMLQNRLIRLHQTELLLNTGGGHTQSPEQEALNWFDEYNMNHGQKVGSVFMKFQNTLLELYTGKDRSREEIAIDFLNVYANLVTDSLDSREEYMKKKLSSLAGNDMEQLVTRLGESWLYPIHIKGASAKDAKQRLYVLGDSRNFFCGKILEYGGYHVTFKESMMDDRLEIVRISERFSEHSISGYRQENEL